MISISPSKGQFKGLSKVGKSQIAGQHPLPLGNLADTSISPVLKSMCFAVVSFTDLKMESNVALSISFPFSNIKLWIDPV